MSLEPMISHFSHYYQRKGILALSLVADER